MCVMKEHVPFLDGMFVDNNLYFTSSEKNALFSWDGNETVFIGRFFEHPSTQINMFRKVIKRREKLL